MSLPHPYNTRLENILSTYPNCMVLFIEPTTNTFEFDTILQKHIDSHNNQPINEINAGFDLITPTDIVYTNRKLENTTLVNYKIKTKALIYDDKGKIYPTGFDLRARSSIYKINARLANGVGTIDSGYRGEIMARFDHETIFQKGDQYSTEYGFKIWSRIVQIVAPSLMPIIVIKVDSLDSDTIRGSNGFGSTGV